MSFRAGKPPSHVSSPKFRAPHIAVYGHDFERFVGFAPRGLGAHSLADSRAIRLAPASQSFGGGSHFYFAQIHSGGEFLNPEKDPNTKPDPEPLISYPTPNRAANYRRTLSTRRYSIARKSLQLSRTLRATVETSSAFFAVQHCILIRRKNFCHTSG